MVVEEAILVGTSIRVIVVIDLGKVGECNWWLWMAGSVEHVFVSCSMLRFKCTWLLRLGVVSNLDRWVSSQGTCFDSISQETWVMEGE